MATITNDSVPILVRTAQVVGITSAAWWSGMQVAFNMVRGADHGAQQVRAAGSALR